jgi:hypothetical protein
MRFVTTSGDWFALKLNNVYTYLGIDSQENAVLNDCIQWGVNWVQFYGLYTVFGTTVNPNTGNLYTDDLAAFIAKCYGSGMRRVGAIMGAGTSGFVSALNYSASYPSAAFNDYNKECEFWNFPAPGTEKYIDWIASLNWLRGQVSSPDVISAYIANPSGTWGVPEAEDMINAGIDYLETTNYTTYTGPPSNPADASQVISDCLSFLSQAAINIGPNVKYQFNDLMSAEPVFQGPYFGDNGIGATFSEWNTQYSGLSYTGKVRAVKTGFCVFCYDDLKAAL